MESLYRKRANAPFTKSFFDAFLIEGAKIVDV